MTHSKLCTVCTKTPPAKTSVAWKRHLTFRFSTLRADQFALWQAVQFFYQWPVFFRYDGALSFFLRLILHRTCITSWLNFMLCMCKVCFWTMDLGVNFCCLGLPIIYAGILLFIWNPWAVTANFSLCMLGVLASSRLNSLSVIFSHWLCILYN